MRHPPRRNCKARGNSGQYNNRRCGPCAYIVIHLKVIGGMSRRFVKMDTWAGSPGPTSYSPGHLSSYPTAKYWPSAAFNPRAETAPVNNGD